MNSPSTSSLSVCKTAGSFFAIENIPWGWREKAAVIMADNRLGRLDLGAGMFRTREGELPIFESVSLAEEAILKEKQSHAYLPPAGLAEFRNAIQDFILGRSVQPAARAVTFQTIGGAGALRLASDCLSRLNKGKDIYVSAESWADHRRIFERAGLRVQSYPYFSEEKGELDSIKLLNALSVIPEGSVVLLQAACHNPTGCDPSREVWRGILEIVKGKRLLPLFDVAYTGLGKGVEDDLWPVRTFAASRIDMMAAVSCCKSFSLYSERVGALISVTSAPELTERLESQIKTDVQASYSSPPCHGAAVIAKVLMDKELRSAWLEELESQRIELSERRQKLLEELCVTGAPERILKIANQQGLFAWTGLSKEACQRLAREFAIYVPGNGRLCVGAIPESRIADVAAALATVSSAATVGRAEQIIKEFAADLVPSPIGWVETMDYDSYAIRQATSCVYLKVLFPSIIHAAPESTRVHLSELFAELNRCHLRQYDDLAKVVDVPEVENRSSYYFDRMYEACDVPALKGGTVLDDGALLRLLAVHAVSYRRGYDRYLLLRDCHKAGNTKLIPVWTKFSSDAPRNATLTVKCMLDLFGEERTGIALRDACAGEKEVMSSVWKKAGITLPA